MLFQLVGMWTDYLWFDSVGFTSVWTTTMGTRLGLFVVGALLTGGAVWSSLVIAYRSRPLLVPMTPGRWRCSNTAMRSSRCGGC